MKHSNWQHTCLLIAGLLLSSFLVGWRTHGQSRPTLPTQRQWEYQYDTASKSFPSDADKAKVNTYAATGWELVAVVREDYQSVLVFKRLK